MHKLHEMFEKLEECASAYLNKGIEQVDTHEMSMVTDMIKDLTEAMYYYSVYEAMEKYGEELMPEGYDRYGYNRNRYANGRYAPKGRGKRYWDRPYIHAEEWQDEEEWQPDYPMMSNYRMGYSQGSNNNSSSGRQNHNGGSRYGESYDRYDSSRRHYHDTHDEESKRKMQESINDIFNDMENMVQDIAKEMTPTEKDKYRQKLNMMMQKIQ